VNKDEITADVAARLVAAQPAPDQRNVRPEQVAARRRRVANLANTIQAEILHD
jgi:hypothetical protein